MGFQLTPKSHEVEENVEKIGYLALQIWCDFLIPISNLLLKGLGSIDLYATQNDVRV